jgi:hypothetical protein
MAFGEKCGHGRNGRVQAWCTWKLVAAGMSHTRSVPSIEEDSSQAQSSLTCRSVMRSLCPSNRRTCAMAYVAGTQDCHESADRGSSRYESCTNRVISVF